MLELAIVALMLVSLLRGEFLPSRTKSVLTVALALVTFACLSFGQTSTVNNQGTASLYLYFASTAIILMLVSRLAPSGSGGGGADRPRSVARAGACAHRPRHHRRARQRDRQ
jgi:hypothetical protein